jgi:hypothetical protein
VCPQRRTARLPVARTEFLPARSYDPPPRRRYIDAWGLDPVHTSSSQPQEYHGHRHAVLGNLPGIFVGAIARQQRSGLTHTADCLQPLCSNQRDLMCAARAAADRTLTIRRATRGDRLEDCIAVLAANGSAPGAPHLVPQLLGREVPVAAAHQPGPIDRLTTARYRATARSR